jgi:hypothetical protein
MPVRTDCVDGASRGAKSFGVVLALRDRVVQVDPMPSMNVAEHFDLPELRDHRAVGIAAHRHARLKEHIRTRLHIRVGRWIPRLRQAGMQVGDVIGRQENNDSLGSTERSIE